MMNRRGILLGLMSALAAPAIAHAGNLMPIKALIIEPVKPTWIIQGIDVYGNRVTEVIEAANAGDPEAWNSSYGKFSSIESIHAPDPLEPSNHMLWSVTQVDNRNQYDTVDLGLTNAVDRNYSGRFLPSA